MVVRVGSDSEEKARCSRERQEVSGISHRREKAVEALVIAQRELRHELLFKPAEEFASTNIELPFPLTMGTAILRGDPQPMLSVREDTECPIRQQQRIAP